MILLFVSSFEWTFGDEPSHQAIVRRKDQTLEVAKTALLQCETNHIFRALAAPTSRRQDRAGSIECDHDSFFIPFATCPCLAVDRRNKVESPSG
ncbi:hypothetical protein LPJ38_05800 [Bradyrhizobium daqingense]|uniref:hypothetical protein n=1 Tax=Bradyrhizobium daqingense TaxID=993502 RepID=UPI00142EEBC2|nr:hypothetical protein [Bradyrhizobium daqingense]UFS90296.1 hypothetical protein LPJ38_05800 [Bradyrhizobium daqingense]